MGLTLKNKVVLIENDEILKQYLKERLNKAGIEVVCCKDGFEGSLKIKNENPDLIISACELSRVDIFTLIREKNEYKSTVNIPVIVLEKERNLEIEKQLAELQVSAILLKPLKVDLLFRNICKLLGCRIDFDRTRSIIDAHINEDILFVEISDGLNAEKIDLLTYKIRSMVEDYAKILTKVLIICSNISNSPRLNMKLEQLITSITDETAAVSSTIRILTPQDSAVAKAVKEDKKFANIPIVENLSEAISSFGKINVFAHESEVDEINTFILTSANEKVSVYLPMDLHFASEDDPMKSQYSVAIIDDDLPILEYLETVFESEGWKTTAYETPVAFIKELQHVRPDIIFLDLMMPKINGVQVIQYLRKNKINIPIVVITAISQKEVITRVKEYGVSYFLTKPLHMNVILDTAKDALGIS
ncbi:MAG: response regulator [Spirochaetales bacterium]|nr:response regulator [Spirochaetales bacterium]